MATPLRESLVRLLSVAAHVSKQTQEQQLMTLGLTVREHVTLSAIAEGAPTQLAIARMAGLDKSTLTPVLDELERRELITRRPDPQDRRARLVMITTAGRRTLNHASKTSTEVEQDLLSDLTGAEQAHLRALLQRTVERMARLSVPGSCL